MVKFLVLLRYHFKKYFCNFRLFETEFPKQCDCTLETDDQNSLFPTGLRKSLPHGYRSWISFVNSWCNFSDFSTTYG